MKKNRRQIRKIFEITFVFAFVLVFAIPVSVLTANPVDNKSNEYKIDDVEASVSDSFGPSIGEKVAINDTVYGNISHQDASSATDANECPCRSKNTSTSYTEVTARPQSSGYNSGSYKYVTLEGDSFDYVVNDFTFYPIPDIPKPEKGVTFQDPTFHPDITRITDASADVGGTNFCMSGYPKHNIENADGTMLMIQCDEWWENRWFIFDANTYENLRQIPSEYVDTPNFQYQDPDVRWDNAEPDVFYTTATSKFYKCNASDDPISCVELHDFQDDFPGEDVRRAYTKEEGDASDDRRYWAFIIRCYDGRWYDTAAVVYDKDFYGKDSGEVISILDDTDPKFHGAGFIAMSPSGKYVWLPSYSDRHYIYPRDFSSDRYLGCSGHADMAISAEGKEVVVCFKYYSQMGATWIQMVDIETGVATWLAPKGEGSAHISGNSHDKPGWAVVSVYTPSYPEEPDNWAEHSVYMVELTTRIDPPPQVWRITHTHTCRERGRDDPFAKINKKGTKLWFGSGWGQSINHEGAQYDVYQVDLPETWWEDLAVGIHDDRVLKLATGFSLFQNYPNPFNPSTTIRYTLPDRDREGRPHRATLKVYNILGELVRTLVDEEQAPGFYRVVWDGKDNLGREVSSGVYFCGVRAGEFCAVRKMLLLR